MTKTEELRDPDSCLSRAAPDEWIFVLLARDAAAPVTIRFWVSERLKSGKNKPEDGTIVSALAIAARMEEQRGRRVGT